MLQLSRAQVREVDQRAIEEYHIPGIVLMENAARAIAEEACQMLGGDCTANILILCGGGNNGGDGLAVARHLHNRAANVVIGLTVDPASYKGDARINWEIVKAMKIEARAYEGKMLMEPRPALLIDAIFGTGLSTPPREPFGRIVAEINDARLPVLAVDVPSGLDCDTGLALGACVAAKKTVTFVAEKIGFTNPEARRFLGEVIVADIGCPRELVRD